MNFIDGLEGVADFVCGALVGSGVTAEVEEQSCCGSCYSVGAFRGSVSRKFIDRKRRTGGPYQQQLELYFRL